MKKLVHRNAIELLTFLLVALLLGLFLSCENNVIKDDWPIIKVEIEVIPEALPAGVDLYFPIVVKVYEPEGVEYDSVRCEVIDPQGVDFTTFYLYDDGSVYNHLPESDFLSLRSGDIVPGDNRFTRQINGRGFENNYGSYLFRFEIPVPPSSGAEDSIEIRPVEVPFFTEITPVIDSLPSGFEPVEYEAHIQKPTAIDRIDSVCLEISYSTRPQPILRQISFDPTVDDTVWVLTLTPGHFWGIETGLYDFHFVLWDRFGLSADTSHDYVGFWNGVPTVFNSTLPDTIWRPHPGEPNDTTAVTVQADDPESLLDIAEVRFETRKVWQTEWQGHPDFYLLDLGGEWDEIAGDGIYAVPLVTSTSDSLHNNLFYFRFYATDRTGQSSDYLVDSVWVVERPGAL
jgi:hypothetical protein